MTDYETLNLQLKGLIDGENEIIPNLANASALLWQNMKELNWAGFYLMKNGELLLAPFQGKPACIHIPVGRGVCGTAVAQDKVQRVDDVHKFAGHIACDSASASEIVIPLHDKSNNVIGVLDIDSPILNRFSEEDEKGLCAFAKILESFL